MPTAGQWTWPESLDAIIRAESLAAGVPLDLAFTFIAVESSFNPNAQAISAIEESYGLLQLNRRGGQGAGYTPQQLLDPTTNLRIGLPYIRLAFEQSWSAGIAPRTFIYLVATRSGHPGQIPEEDQRMVNIRNAWAIFYPQVGASLQGPGPITSPRHAPAPAAMAALAIPFSAFMAPAILAATIPVSLFGGGIFAQLQSQVLGLGQLRPDRYLRQLNRTALAGVDDAAASLARRRGRRGRRDL